MVMMETLLVSAAMQTTAVMDGNLPRRGMIGRGPKLRLLPRRVILSSRYELSHGPIGQKYHLSTGQSLIPGIRGGPFHPGAFLKAETPNRPFSRLWEEAELFDGDVLSVLCIVKGHLVGLQCREAMRRGLEMPHGLSTHVYLGVPQLLAKTFPPRLVRPTQAVIVLVGFGEAQQRRRIEEGRDATLQFLGKELCRRAIPMAMALIAGEGFHSLSAFPYGWFRHDAIYARRSESMRLVM